MTRIRPAVPADTARVEAIAQRAYAYYVPRMGRRPGPMDADYDAAVGEGRTSVLELADGTIAGYAVLTPAGDHLELDILGVDPDHQGRGLGRALIDHAERTAAGLGLGEVRLSTNVAMTENQQMYTHLGYRETDRRVGDGFNRVYYVKIIN